MIECCIRNGAPGGLGKPTHFIAVNTAHGQKEERTRPGTATAASMRVLARDIPAA